MSLPEEKSLQVEASFSFGKRVELAVSHVYLILYRILSSYIST